jgi:uncharacterized RDD family membrane protein YckC
MATTTPQPAAPGSPKPQVPTFRPAGFFSRFEAFVIDLIILSVVQLVASAFIQTVLRFFQLTELAATIKTVLENSTYEITIGATLFTLFVIGYYVFFWTLVGFTPGKALLGLKVVRKDGAKVSFGRALLRFFAYWISMLPLFLGFLWVIWDSKRQGWHDKIAGTQVLYIPKNLRK